MPRTVREWIIVLWPAFMAACVLETLVFAGFDPHDIHLFGLTFESDRETVYSLAFLAFWAVTTGAGVMTWILAQPATPIAPGHGLTHDAASAPAAPREPGSPG